MAFPAFQSDLNAESRVMVIDPLSVHRDMLGQALEGVGCQVEFASDGFEALSKMHEFGPSFVFCAMDCPRLNGYQVCEIVRGTRRFGSIPFIITRDSSGIFENAAAKIRGVTAQVLQPLTHQAIQDAFVRYAD